MLVTIRSFLIASVAFFLLFFFSSRPTVKNYDVCQQRARACLVQPFKDWDMYKMPVSISLFKILYPIEGTPGVVSLRFSEVATKIYRLPYLSLSFLKKIYYTAVGSFLHRRGDYAASRSCCTDVTGNTFVHLSKESSEIFERGHANSSRRFQPCQSHERRTLVYANYSR